VAATASYQIWQSALPDTQEVAAEIRRSGYDGIFVVSKLETQRETTRVPAYTKTDSVVTFNPWRDTYQTVYNKTAVAGYTETERVNRHHVDVWSTRGQGRLV